MPLDLTNLYLGRRPASRIMMRVQVVDAATPETAAKGFHHGAEWTRFYALILGNLSVAAERVW